MSNQALVVHILGKEYQVSCPDGEENALLKSATELDRRMREIRQAGGIIGLERIAVMAGLNLAHDLLKAQSTPMVENQQVQVVSEKIEEFLS